MRRDTRRAPRRDRRVRRGLWGARGGPAGRECWRGSAGSAEESLRGRLRHVRTVGGGPRWGVQPRRTAVGPTPSPSHPPPHPATHPSIPDRPVQTPGSRACGPPREPREPSCSRALAQPVGGGGWVRGWAGGCGGAWVRGCVGSWYGLYGRCSSRTQCSRATRCRPPSLPPYVPRALGRMCPRRRPEPVAPSPSPRARRPEPVSDMPRCDEGPRLHHERPLHHVSQAAATLAAPVRRTPAFWPQERRGGPPWELRRRRLAATRGLAASDHLRPPNRRRWP